MIFFIVTELGSACRAAGDSGMKVLDTLDQGKGSGCDYWQSCISWEVIFFAC